MTEKLVEVSESLLASLQGTSKMTNELWNDPKFGPQIKEIVKEKYPNANIPEVEAARTVKKAESDILSKVEEANKATLARIDAFEAANKKEKDDAAAKKAEADFAADIENTKKKYQLTAEGMEKVFARMKEKNNPDVEAAAAWVTDHEPRQEPVTNSSYTPGSMDLFGSQTGAKEFEEINKHAFDGQWFDKEVRAINEDFINGRGGLYGVDGMGGQK